MTVYNPYDDLIKHSAVYAGFKRSFLSECYNVDILLLELSSCTLFLKIYILESLQLLGCGVNGLGFGTL
jgi:hypothetical protein